MSFLFYGEFSKFVMKNFLGYLLIIIVLCGMVSFVGVRNGYTSTCHTAVGGSSTAMTLIGTIITMAEIGAAEAAIQAFYQVLLKFVEGIIESVLLELLDELFAFSDMFWDYDLKPAMQKMTSQLHTSSIDASRNHGSFVDGQEMAGTLLGLKDSEVGAHRFSRPGTIECQAASIMSGMFLLDEIKEGYARAAPIEQSAMSSASLGTSAADGDESHQNELWNDYCDRYVDPQSNKGLTGCAAAGVFTGESFKAASLFEDTYDVTDPELKRNVDDWVRNICDPKPIERFQLDELDTTAGKRAFMRGMSHMAQQQLCYSALYHVQSRRVPGSQMGGADTPIAEHALRGGVNPLSLHPNPSWTEIENILEASTAKEFQHSLVDDPELVQRALVVKDVYSRTYGMSEIKDAQEKTSALFAVLGARELEEMTLDSNIMAANPKR